MLDISDDAPPPAPPEPPPLKHAGWDAPITQPLPSPRQYPLRPSNAKDPSAVGGIGKAPSKQESNATTLSWSELSAKLPTGRDAESTARRKALFNKFDPNGNGMLSLAEIDKAIRDVIKSKLMFNAKPVIMRAYKAARGASTRPTASADFVDRSEFRLLLASLRSYFELYAAFERLDTSSDRRLDIDEWRAGVALLARWGIQLSPSDVDDEFKRIDKNKGGHILFDEFCDWAIARRLALGDAAASSSGASSLVPAPAARPARPASKGPSLQWTPPPDASAITPKGATVPVRPVAAFGGVQRFVPRPTSARSDFATAHSPRLNRSVPMNTVGWRGGGTSQRAASTSNDEVLARQQALDVVALHAAQGFSKARAAGAPPPSPGAHVAEAKEKEAIARKAAVNATGAAARRAAKAAISVDEKSARRWSAHANKIPPNTAHVTAPSERHVPKMSDQYVGTPSELTLMAGEYGRADYGRFDVGGAPSLQFGGQSKRSGHKAVIDPKQKPPAFPWGIPHLERDHATRFRGDIDAKGWR